MNAAISLVEPYAPRSVRSFDCLTFDGWRVKLYGIAYRSERPVQALVDAAVAAAQQSLPRPAVTHERYGLGFVGAHDGRGANFVFVDWWANEDELHHHTWLSSKEEPGRLRATGRDDFTACAWDLAVIAHERGAWIRHVLARPLGPDVGAYLADQLHADVLTVALHRSRLDPAGLRADSAEAARDASARWRPGDLEPAVASAENPLREVIEVAGPGLGGVAFVVDIPDVRHVALLEVDVDALRDVDEPVLVAAGEVQELQLRLRRRRIRHELGGRPGVRRGGERPDPREGVEVPEPEVQGLPAAHREAGQGPVFAIRERGVLRLDRGNQMVQQVLLEPGEAGHLLRCELIAGRAVVGKRAAVGDHDDHRHRDVVSDQVIEEGVRRREADPFCLVAADAVQQVEHGVFPVARVAGRQIHVRFAPRVGDPRVILERFDATGRQARASLSPARVGERPDIVGAEHDGSAHGAASLPGRRSLGPLLGRCRGSGGEQQDRRGEYGDAVFHHVVRTRRHPCRLAKAIIGEYTATPRSDGRATSRCRFLPKNAESLSNGIR